MIAAFLVVCALASGCPAADGTTQPNGTALNRILAAPDFNPGAGLALIPDDGRAVYQPATAPLAQISSAEFQARFTSAEQQAVWQAAVGNPALGQGLVNGLSVGTVDLSGCPSACANTTLKSWMDGLVTAAAITAARETAILTP